MNLESLRSLQKRIREAIDPDRELDGDIIVALKGGEIVWKMANYTMEQYPAHRYPSKNHLSGFANEHVPLLTASIDACVALMREVLPGCEWSRDSAWCFWIWEQISKNAWDAKKRIDGGPYRLANDCLTFLDAIFSAAIAQEEAKHTEKAAQCKKRR